MELSSIKQAAFEYIEPGLRYLYRLYRHYLNNTINFFKLYESENKLAADAQKYWDKDYSEKPKLAQDAHWKNNGIFENHERWLKLGKEHIDLVKNYTSILKPHQKIGQIVEWGCGGGANAVHFAPYAKKFIGIDVAIESLDECKKQLSNIGLSNFQPLLINASTPELVLDGQIAETDLFICTYVYELFPSPAYGINVLELAYKMLKPGGMAFIQIRYNDGRKDLRPKRWGYKFNATFMTTYTLEEFWNYSSKIGFEHVNLFLKPKQPLVDDRCYAYYFLRKMEKEV
jgi:2-polyprenyl-3-methyl-5-hydroxy-6-metoxy-1,4-benzoquinol methylase